MQQWFVKLSGEEVGPLTSKEIRELAQAGGLKPETPISPDRQQWRQASSIENLRFGKALSADTTSTAVEVQPKPKPTESASNSSPRRFNINAYWPLVVALVLIGQGWKLIANRQRNLASSTAAANPVQPAPVAAAPAPTPEEIMGQATLTYWKNSGNAIQAGLREGIRTKTSEGVLNGVTVAEHLPVTNVDPAAIQTVLEVCASLRDFIQVNEQSKDPALLMESLARGLAGDPFGTALQMRKEEQRIKKRFQYVEGNMTRMRALLSQHYGIEFPPLLHGASNDGNR